MATIKQDLGLIAGSVTSINGQTGSITLDGDNLNATYKDKTGSINKTFEQIETNIKTDIKTIETDLENYVKKSNDVLSTASDQYKSNSKFGINMNNSDIIGCNSIYTQDSADSTSEGIRFYRDSSHWDSLTASGGSLYFMPNDTLNGTAFSSAKKVAMTSDIPTSLPANGGTANALNPTNITIQTGSSKIAKIELGTLMTWLINKGYIPNNTYVSKVITTSWAYANNDILRLIAEGVYFELQLAGVVIEFDGKYNKDNLADSMCRIRIHSSPTTAFTLASGYTKFPTSHIAEYTCNGSGYTPTWKIIATRYGDIDAKTISNTPGWDLSLYSSCDIQVKSMIYMNKGLSSYSYIDRYVNNDWWELLGFKNSLTTKSGYFRAHSGFIIQWGSGTATSVTMPLSFKSATSYIVVSQFNVDRGCAHYDREVYRPSTANTLVKVNSYECQWIAIGY